MSELTHEETKAQVQIAEKCDPYSMVEIPATTYLHLARMANRLAQIERQMIYRTADMPEWAVAWNKAASGRYCWFVGLHIAQEADNPTPQPAPDLRPDEPGPLWLPIIDALDADEEG